MPIRKRVVAEESDAPRRSSRRISSTPQKSKYFDDDSDEDELPPKKRGRLAKKTQALKTEDSGEQYKEDSEVESEVDEGEEEEDDESLPPKKRGRPAKKPEALKKKDSGEDDDEDDEVDEDAPMKVTIIPLEKMRDEGGVAYQDDKVHKNSLLFLRDLKANNQRPWLKSHDGEYRRAWQDWITFVDRTTETMIEADETIPELPAKDLIFRIYRDIRFSKNPTPYKAHFSAAWSRTGRKGPYASYYIHVEPKSCFIAGGLWCPDAPSLSKLRASIDERPERWRRVLNDPAFKDTFLPGAKAGGVVTAFAERNKENALKSKPRGFTTDHRDIELLRLRNFCVSAKLGDKDVCGDGAQDKVAAIIRPMVIFITFLNSVVMPDPGQDDGEEDERGQGMDGDEEEEEEEDEEEED